MDLHLKNQIAMPPVGTIFSPSGIPVKSNKAKTPAEAAQEILAFANIIKAEFPNLDPNFFKSPRLLNLEKETVKKPYQNNVWVYSACGAISTNLLQVPKGLDLRGTKEEEFIEEHPLLDLLDNPNPLMDGMAFWETIILALLLPTSKTNGGQCFILAESRTNRPVDLRRGDIPAELWPFTDEFIKPILNENNILQYWQLDLGKNKINYRPEEVIRIRLLDPYDVYRGQSPLIAAMQGMRSDIKAQTVNERFFDNNASLGGTLETDASPGPEEVKSMKRQFEELYGGPENAGKVAVLAHGLKYQQFQRSHLDMDYIEQRKFTRDEILAVYRVPKAEVSVYEDINYATSKMADKAFWKKTLIPYDKRILKALNDQWIKYTDSGRFKLRSDYSKVEALQEDLTDKLKQAIDLAKLNVPMEEINRRLEMNLKIEQYEWLKTALVNFNLVPAENVVEGKEDPKDPADPEDEKPEDTEEEDPDKYIDSIFQKEADNFQAHYWESTVVPGIKTFQKKMGDFFLGQLRRNIKLVRDWKKIAHEGTYPNPNDMVLNSVPENELLRSKQLPEFKKAILREKARMESELGEEIVKPTELDFSSVSKKIGWDEDGPEMQSAIRRRLASLDGINGVTFAAALERVKEIISQAVRERLTVQETAKLLEEEIGYLYKKRARHTLTIARTEIGSVHSEARFDIMKSAGVKEIEWLDSKDDLVRDGKNGGFSHRPKAFKTTKVNLGSPFNNGEDIRYPRDPRASAGNVINCRCTFRIAKK